jgi:phenylacetyl-CoA:acceptor oxidoreductase subunit 2
MTREACVGMVLFPTALAALALDSIVLYALAALLTLLFLYCQARILKAAAGVPAWREPAIVPLIMFSGAVEGCALVVAASALADSAATWVIIALMVLLGVRVWSWFAYVDALRRAQAPSPALSVLQGIQREVLVFGTALPMALILASFTGIATVPALVLSSAVVIAVGWRVKHTIVIKAAYKQGYGVGKLRKGRPQPRVPVRRAGDPVQY